MIYPNPPVQEAEIVEENPAQVAVDPQQFSGRSPVPQITRKPVEMNFLDALLKAVDGKKITRLAWESNETFGQMKDEQLHIFTRGQYFLWTIVPGDITATDWIVLPE